MVKALVIRTAGTNCDAELCRAFRLAGAEPSLVHLNSLIADPAELDRFDLIGFPGGFSYGDDVASGRIFAMRVRERLYPALRAAVLRGCPVIGVCNGFQVLVQVGLLPGPLGADEWPRGAAPAQTCTLSENQDARFHDHWTPVRYEPDSVCIWTRGLAEACADSHAALLPVAHGEGRFMTLSPAILSAIESGAQVALRYTENYNGSESAIAGICDTTGRVFGLMPHPERFLDWTRHPFWTRLPTASRDTTTPGLLVFRNAVEAAVPVHR